MPSQVRAELHIVLQSTYLLVTHLSFTTSHVHGYITIGIRIYYKMF